jgi:hypothetical protein
LPRDYQKEEAKRSLWDCDGSHIWKKYRNKGKGRNKEKADIRKEIADLTNQIRLDKDDQLCDEAEDAWYCHSYGPCAQCREQE